MRILRESANDEIVERISKITDPTKISVLNYVLDKNFTSLTYLDSTLLRDILKVDLNHLVLYFNKF